MATPARTAANQRNAQHSTGPRTPEGKTRSAANATASGLFTAHAFVRPGEQSDYETFIATWRDELQPAGPSEETFALQIIQSAWRLRRCAFLEASLHTTEHFDPQLDPAAGPLQNSIDRAQLRAHSILRRSITDLRLLQTERQIRERLLDADDNPDLGLASTRQFLAAIAADDRAHMKRRKIEDLHTVEDIIDSTLPPNAPRTPTPTPSHQPAAYPRQTEPLSSATATLSHQPAADPRETHAPSTTRPTPSHQPAADPHQTEPLSSATATPSHQPAAYPRETQSASTTPGPWVRSAPAHTDTPRNAPCPCGSGLKYKRCCGTDAPPVLNDANCAA